MASRMAIIKRRVLFHVDISARFFGVGFVVSSRLGLSIMLGPILIQLFALEDTDVRSDG